MDIKSEPLSQIDELSTSSVQLQGEIKAKSPLECNICFDESSEPVTTRCGHIYCWTCIYKQLTDNSKESHCPVCSKVVLEDSIISLYPKDYTDKKTKVDESVPKRPHARREEESRYTGFGHTLFTGINVPMPNFARRIGYLPIFIPLVTIIVLNLFALFFTDDDDSDDNSDDRGCTMTDSADSSDDMVYSATDKLNIGLYNEFYETDEFDLIVIALMIALISLPFALRRFRRN